MIFTGTNLCFILHKLDLANAMSLGTLLRLFIVCFLSFHEIDGCKFGHSALTKQRLLFPTGERQIADQMTIYKYRRGVAIGSAENKPSRRRVNGAAMNQILSPAPKSLA